MVDPDLVQLHVQFLGHEGDQRRVDALAHLGARRNDGDALARDLGVERQRRLIWGKPRDQRVLQPGIVGANAEDHAGRDRDRGDEDAAPRLCS